MTIIRHQDAQMRRGESLEIRNLITDAISAKFSVAAVDLHGPHGPTRSHSSDRAYVILEGSAVVTLGQQSHDVAAGDAVFIPQGTPHGIRGDARYIVINSPPFDPQQEESI